MNRDKILEQALTHQLRDIDAPVTPACLDAETIAAWIDGGLDEHGVAAAESHAASCSRCQALIATAAVAPTTLAPSTSAPGTWHEAPGTRHPAPGTPAPSTHAPGTFRWWLPLGVAAAAGVIWMVVPQQRQIATAPSVAPAQQAAAPRESSAQGQTASTQTIPAAAPESPSPARERLETKKAQQSTEQPAARAESNERRDAARLEAPAAAAAPPAARANVNAARMSAGRADIEAPDGSRRWRLADYGPGVTGGAAVSSTTCWLIGRDGLVMLSTDGNTFNRVDIPEKVDVIAITPTDGRSATITTGGGRQFITDDGGRTWRRIQA